MRGETCTALEQGCEAMLLARVENVSEPRLRPIFLPSLPRISSHRSAKPTSSGSSVFPRELSGMLKLGGTSVSGPGAGLVACGAAAGSQMLASTCLVGPLGKVDHQAL